MRKQLFHIFGPIVLTIFLLVAIFLVPVQQNVGNERQIVKAATSMNADILKGNTLKNEAMASGRYVPFFGSSELSRLSPFHPSVIAEKYQRNYRPFLLGTAGTQSLAQAMSIQSIGKNLQRKKAIFIVSPQWFVPNGVKEDYFETNYSQLQAYNWAANVKSSDKNDQYLAQRLSEFPKVQKDRFFYRILEKLQLGELPTEAERQQLLVRSNVLQREDELFSNYQLGDRQKQVQQAAELLPDTYDFSRLDQLAFQLGKAETSNNDLEIENNFYTRRLKKELKKLENTQKNWSYCYSREFSDFQAVLNQFAKENIEVLFILPPVNERWTEYTGLSQEMLQDFSKKICYQLETQGFHSIADFSKFGSVDYFMTDTIHLGWRGWLYADQYIQQFLVNNQQEPVSYHLNNYFYTRDWQEKSPNEIE